MSWLDSLFHKKTSAPAAVTASAPEGPQYDEYIYVSVDHVSLRVLCVESLIGGTDRCIVWTEEKFFGPYEGLAEGERVKNFFVHLIKAVNELSHRLEGKTRVSVSIPLDGTFVSNIIIPKTDKPQNLLAAEMKKKVPIPFNEILFASNKVHEMNNLESYCVVAMQKSVFEDYVQVFKNFGVEPYIELGIFSLPRLFPARTLSKQYKVLVYVSHYKVQMIFCKNNMVMEVVVLEKGFSQAEDLLMQKAGVDRAIARKVIDNLEVLKNSHRESYKEVQKIEDENNESLAQEISHAALNFESKFNIHLEYMYLTSTKNMDSLKGFLQTKNNNTFVVENFTTGDIADTFTITEDVKRDSLTRYTHTLGLAKKDI